MTIESGKFRAVVFDLDGTLVDSAPDIAAALDQVLIEHGCAPVGVAAVRLMIGGGAGRLLERGLAASGGDAGQSGALLPRFLAIYEARIAALTRPFPGVVATLAALRRRRRRLGICTNKPARATRALVDALDLARYFDSLIGGDGRRKPDPEPVLRCLAALGVEASVALFVGDSGVDVAAARAAGLEVVLVDFGYSEIPAGELGADAVVSSFAELDMLIG